MARLITTAHQINTTSDLDGLTFLKAQQIVMIDEALASLGDFGEVRLVVEKGRLRFLTMQKSMDALKWAPGTIIGSPTG